MKKDYYKNGRRMVIGGIPTWVAPWVKDLSPNARKLLGRGSYDPKPNDAVTIANRFYQTTYLPPEKK